MFCENSDIANYADDNFPFSRNKNIESVILQLVNDSKIPFEWFDLNGLKGRQSPKFALFFNLRNRISFKNLNEQKKRIKKY